MVQQIIQAFSSLDYPRQRCRCFMYENADRERDLDRLTEHFWNAILTTNLIGPFRCAKEAAEALRQSHGAIVNTTSATGVHAGGSGMAYSASKAGLINLTKNPRGDLRQRYASMQSHQESWIPNGRRLGQKRLDKALPTARS